MNKEKSPFAKREEEILKFWQEHKIFEKSLKQREHSPIFSFYDGPPFATGLPHYGHILSSVIKDVVPRYWTMKGYYIPRRWGWDCHGLPIEILVEKELKVSGKKEIEEKIGIKKFNETARTKVLMFTKEWKKMVDRIGRWIEFDNSYKTMDSTYMESVWWALKTAWDKNLIYEGRKVLLYCPRCETPISKAEVAMDNSYQNITEESVTIRFKIKDSRKIGLPKNTYILAWTTTPWTLPGNVALAVSKELTYVLAEVGKEVLILVQDRLQANFGDKKYKIIKKLKGKELIGLDYEPLYEIEAVKKSGKRAWYVTDADFVTTEDGTGVVHTAVIYGEEDYELGVRVNLPMVPLLNEKGIFNKEAPQFIRGKYFKNSEKDIKDDLEGRGLIFVKENFTHPYPFCWRCDTQLFYNAISAWFINIQKIKKRLIELNEKIHWYPEHLKHGRFLNILETAPDWNISRSRYWATPLPFWKCHNEKCGHAECVGSVQELKEKAINFSDVYESDKVEKMDLHKHLMDKIKLKCEKCGGEMSRIPEVVDCWVESASMPFAEWHYPFENKEFFKKKFPAQYIAEYIAQTRAWFYYMHVISTILFDDVSFQNCVTTGTILNERGEKLSKSKMNYTDPWILIDKYGMDSLRYYLMTSVVMQADDLYFNDNEVREAYNKVINVLLNVLAFYKSYSQGKPAGFKLGKIKNVLDEWILNRLTQLEKEVTKWMDNYNTVKAGKPIAAFINDLSTWYLRRSRERFKQGDDAGVQVFGHVLLELSKIMAPFMPFVAEYVYKEAGGEKESVHLEEWPSFASTSAKASADKKATEGKPQKIQSEVLENMELVRKIVEMGLAKRAEAKIKVRQPLHKLKVTSCQLPDEYVQLIQDELNVKEVEFKKGKELAVELDVTLSPELALEGEAREFIRQINSMRKEQKLTVRDTIKIYYDGDIDAMVKEFKSEILKATVAKNIERGEGDREIKVNEKKVMVRVEKIE